MNKFRISVAAAAAVLVLAPSCEQDDPNGPYSYPQLNIAYETVSMGYASRDRGTQVILASREWHTESHADWFTVYPQWGSASLKSINLAIVATEYNFGYDRYSTASVWIDGIEKTFRVVQRGTGGNANQGTAYLNNFDWKPVQSDVLAHSCDSWRDSIWTYSYGYDSIYVSPACPSNADALSDYGFDASGANNILLPTDTSYLAIRDLSIGDSTDFLLSFGSYGKDIKAYVGNPSNRFVQLDLKRDADDGWGRNLSRFNVPERTGCISLYFGGKGRLDDVCLAYCSDSIPQMVDFALGDSLDVSRLPYDSELYQPVLFWEDLRDSVRDCGATNRNVWKHSPADSAMVARGYFNGALRVSDCYLVTPTVEIPDTCTTAKLSFKQAWDRYASVEKARKAVSVEIRYLVGEYELSDWETLDVTYPSEVDGKFVDSGKIDLGAYAGKEVMIGFHYTSTVVSAGIWKIRDILITKE